MDQSQLWADVFGITGWILAVGCSLEIAHLLKINVELKKAKKANEASFLEFLNVRREIADLLRTTRHGFIRGGVKTKLQSEEE